MSPSIRERSILFNGAPSVRINLKTRRLSVRINFKNKETVGEDYIKNKETVTCNVYETGDAIYFQVGFKQ